MILMFQQQRRPGRHPRVAGVDAAAIGVDLGALRKARQDRADHRVGAEPLKRREEMRQPLWRDLLIVVEKGEIAPGGMLDAGIAGLGDAGSWLVDIADRHRAARRHHRRDGLAGTRGIVVDDEDFIGRRDALLRQHAGDRPREIVRPAIGRNDDARFDHQGHPLSLARGWREGD